MKGHSVVIELLPELEKFASQARYQPRALGRLCHMNPRLLEREFHKYFGVSPTAWLESYRERRAEQLALAGWRAKEIANDLGYKQLSHFSRKFKETHGITLRNWKKAHGQPAEKPGAKRFTAPVAGR
jgi:AraC-like DNA-binding protein